MKKIESDKEKTKESYQLIRGPQTKGKDLLAHQDFKGYPSGPVLEQICKLGKFSKGTRIKENGVEFVGFFFGKSSINIDVKIKNKEDLEGVIAEQLVYGNKVYKHPERASKLLVYLLRDIVKSNEQRSKKKVIKTMSGFSVREYTCVLGFRDLANKRWRRKRIGKEISEDLNYLLSQQVDLSKYKPLKPLKNDYLKKFNALEAISVENGGDSC
jgi:hypothetical protein